MKRLFLFLCLLPFLLLQANDALFSHDDPTSFHHVSVISGNLHLSFQDVALLGPVPFALSRSYSSSGALEKNKDKIDISLQSYREGWMPLGGWDLLAYTHLLIEPGRSNKGFKAYLSEKNGGTLAYGYHSRKGDSKISFVLKPTQKIPRCCGQLSARTNPHNNFLIVDPRSIVQNLHTADGGMRSYVGRKMTDFPGEFLYTRRHFYRLAEEVLPSRHRISYIYNKANDLIRIDVKNPRGDKAFASLNFQPARDKTILRQLKVKTSDGKELSYRTSCLDETYYLNDLTSNFRPQENCHHGSTRYGIGARVSSVVLAGKEQLRVTYYVPGSRAEEERWLNHPAEKPLHIDRVKTIEAPTGPRGEMAVVASFSYTKETTEARDASSLLTRYHHDGERLLKIAYFDHNDQLHSYQRFYWQDMNLVCKAFFDAAGNAVFAKTFSYDALGNVTEETLWGLLTGEERPALAIDEQGKPSGGESYTKTYTYLPLFNVVTEEKEEGGLSYRYTYKPGSNLMTSRLTLSGDTILQREFYEYDDDNLLVAEITDDGSSPHKENLEGVQQRSLKRYKLSPVTGLAQTVEELYLDAAGCEQLLKKTILTYAGLQVIEEAVYDASNSYCYTIYTSYDAAGRVLSKTTPSGQTNSYRYDDFGQLLFAKEEGSAAKTYDYDAAGRQIRHETYGKVGTTSYDLKGHIVNESDLKGRLMQHSYDAFGNRLTTTFPAVTDERGQIYSPTVHFAYDIQGNLSKTTLPKGEVTETHYTTWRKPTYILQEDGSHIRQYYTKAGRLLRTVHEDATEERLSYDALGRVILQENLASSGEILATQEWTYSSFNLLSHKDARGLVTHYAYNRAGQKIAEEASSRRVTYSYNALGALEVTKAVTSQHEIKDFSDRTIEVWNEDDSGRRENHMRFFYDQEGRKIRADRWTAEGLASDLFSYDEENRLVCHSDPIGAKTEFIYEETTKTTIDPLGNITVESYDAGDRLILCEKKSPLGKTLFREKFLYDASGNKAKRFSTVFHNEQEKREITVSWEYDTRGRVIKESENNDKVTLYSYDASGHVRQKVQPSGVSLNYLYDGLGRLSRLSSSDGSVDYEYIYAHLDLHYIIDHVHGHTVEREYDIFGALLKEKRHGQETSWEYDSWGRCTLFTLPDRSCLGYTYEGQHMKEVVRLSPQHEVRYKHLYAQFDPNGHVYKEELAYDLGVIETKRDLLERFSAQNSPWLSQKVTYGLSGLVHTISNSLFGDKTCAYDPLRQLTQEGDEKYDFDSLGNPAHYITNEYNQVLQANDGCWEYDRNGNPTKRLALHETTYRYDALNRVTEIISAHNHVYYEYDAFSRLVLKKSDEGQIAYIYDQEREIGTLNEQGAVTQLKVLGLGIKGDIGAAIALELEEEVYIPLHDFVRNIIALVNLKCQIVESYEISSFGHETSSRTPHNPWRFCSKRAEEGFVFFGLRFYDPELGRWLTPDPAGYVDGANLYAYVSNSPLNRLDLFGLWGEDANGLRPGDYLLLKMASTPTYPGMFALVSKGKLGGHDVDWVGSCGHWHKLQFSAEEIKAGEFNLLDHFHELIPRSGSPISLVSFGNGIGNSLLDWKASHDAVAKHVGGTLTLSVYNPTEGAFKDGMRAMSEIMGAETKTVCITRQFLATVSERLYQINENAGWLFIPHSEQGVILKNGIEGLSQEHRAILNKNMHIYACGPAAPIPKHGYAATAKNVYTDKDYVTGWFGNPRMLKIRFCLLSTLDFIYNPRERPTNCDIKILPSISTRDEKMLGFIDHGFLGSTYTSAWQREIDNYRDKQGVYESHHAHTR